ncbi:hypothetical protein E2C01_084056 [Portunus trituberculatus]|uniref:Uncharacterized protein n=1 Tax=Portunus trituberculatus TaxID=210409 RepID=A0A5B7J3V1_PORTR|nr:hypothetical protein [Portunus trituberculatus]
MIGQNPIDFIHFSLLMLSPIVTQVLLSRQSTATRNRYQLPMDCFVGTGAASVGVKCVFLCYDLIRPQSHMTVVRLFYGAVSNLPASTVAPICASVRCGFFNSEHISPQSHVIAVSLL